MSAVGAPRAEPARHLRADFYDVLAHESAHVHLDRRYAQLTPGHYRASMSGVEIPGVLVFFGQVNQGIAARGCLTSPQIALIDFDTNNRWCGAQVRADSLALLQPGVEYTMRTTYPSSATHVLCDIDLLGDELRALVDRRTPGWPTAAPALTVDESAKNHLTSYLHAVLETARTRPESFDVPAVQAELRSEISSRLMSVLLSLESDDGASRPASLERRRRIARDIVDFARAHPDSDLTKHKMCEVAHACSRSVDQAFWDVYGMPPGAFIARLRLNAIRKELLRVSTRHNNLTSVANRFGVWHMGRFSQAYKFLFGESPSATARRLAA